MYEIQTPVFEHQPPFEYSSDWTNDVAGVSGENEFDEPDEAEALFVAMAADWFQCDHHRGVHQARLTRAGAVACGGPSGTVRKEIHRHGEIQDRRSSRGRRHPTGL
jgi:hypothetical protein